VEFYANFQPDISIWEPSCYPRTDTWEDFFARDLAVLRGRLAVWRSLARTEFPDAEFSPEAMMEWNTRLNEVYYSIDPIVIFADYGVRGTQNVSVGDDEYRFDTGFQKQIRGDYLVSYEFATRLNKPSYMNMGFRVIRPAVVLDNRIKEALASEGILEEYLNQLRKLVKECSHDYLHSILNKAAWANSDSRSLNRTFSMDLLAKLEKSRKMRPEFDSNIESFNLSLNGRLHLLHAQSVRSIPSVEAAIVLMQRIEEKMQQNHPAIAEALRKQVIYFLSNYAARSDLESSSIIEWTRLVREKGAEKVCERACVGLDHKTLTHPSIIKYSVLMHRALKQDAEKAGISCNVSHALMSRFFAPQDGTARGAA
jgi:hypothetical protein